MSSSSIPRRDAVIGRLTGEDGRQGDVLQCRHYCNQVECLEDITDGVAAQVGEFPGIELRHVHVVDKDAATVRFIQAADGIKESVDFPEPDGPMMEIYSPRRMSTLTPSSARSFSSPRVNTLTTSFVRTIYSVADTVGFSEYLRTATPPPAHSSQAASPPEAGGEEGRLSDRPEPLALPLWGGVARNEPG